METGEFKLSRIYGQGWNAAKKLLGSGAGKIDASDARTRNPYRTVAERARWAKGFEEASHSRVDSSQSSRYWRAGR